VLDPRYNTFTLVFMAVNDESPIPYSAVHIPGPNVVVHRLCFMLNHCNNTKNLHGSFVPTDVGQDGRFVRFEYIHSDKSIPRVIALADELNALTAASIAFNERDLDRCGEGMKFAVTCWPDVVHQRSYRRLKMKLRVGPSVWNILRCLMFRPRRSDRRDVGSDSIAIRRERPARTVIPN